MEDTVVRVGLEVTDGISGRGARGRHRLGPRQLRCGPGYLQTIEYKSIRWGALKGQ